MKEHEEPHLYMNKNIHSNNKHNKEKKCECAGNSIVRSKGEYLIQVLRTGFSIQAPLPYCIWGAIYLNANNFATVLQPYLPAGVTVTTVIASDTIQFIYANGDIKDFITVFAHPDALLSYPEMLANLNTNYLRSELCYFSNNTNVDDLPTLSDQNNKILQNQPLYLQKIGGLGDKANEYINPLSRRLPNNSVNDVIEVSFRHQEIKNETVWIHKFAYISQGGTLDALQFSFLVIINDIINMNAEKMSIREIHREATT